MRNPISRPQMMNSSTQYNSAPQPCCFIFDVMGWQISSVMQDKAHKTFVCRVNGYSIYWSDRQARRDAYRFIILKNDRQVYDTADLYGAITHCLEEKEWTSAQRKRFIELAKVHDRESVSDFKKR